MNQPDFGIFSTIRPEVECDQKMKVAKKFIFFTFSGEQNEL